MADEAAAKADAAAEKAYAEAAGEVSATKVADAVEADAPKAKPDAGKVAAAIEPKTKAEPAPSRKPAARKKAVASKAKAKPARKAPAKAKLAKASKPTSKPVSNSTSPVSQLKDKIMATAKTTDFTKTAQEATAELQSRAKAAYEKTQAYAGEMTEFTKGNLEAVVESGKILATGLQDIARGEAEAAKGAFETVTADLKALAAVKSPTELFKLQGEIARRNFDAAVAHYSKNAEVSMKLAGDAFAPLSSRVSLAAEKISKAA